MRARVKLQRQEILVENIKSIKYGGNVIEVELKSGEKKELKYRDSRRCLKEYEIAEKKWLEYLSGKEESEKSVLESGEKCKIKGELK